MIVNIGKIYITQNNPKKHMANGDHPQFINEILFDYLRPGEKTDEIVKVCVFSEFVSPPEPEMKTLFSNGFIVVGDAYACAANPTDRKQNNVYLVGGNSDHPFYDFASCLAFERNEVPILPTTPDVAEKIKESFGAVGLDGCITEEQMLTADIIPDPRQALPKFIKVLLYKPKPGIADLYEFIAEDERSAIDVIPVSK
jgi:hypothetical protein